MKTFYVTAKCPELEAAISQLSAYDGRTAKRIEDAVESSTKAISQGAKSRVAVRSGKTKKSITSKFNRQKITGEVYTKRPTAHLLEYGTRAHDIPKDTPGKTSKPLYFKGGFVQKVHHPGAGARPFMRPSYEDERPRLIRKISEAVKP